MDISNEDLRKLGQLTTRDDAGVHFTRRYSREWLDKMEAAGMIKIHKPVHPATKLQYSEEYWTVEVTPEAVAEGEARNWGESYDMQDMARYLGYDSYVQLIDASHCTHQEGDISWFIIPCPDGRWACWDDAELAPDRVRFFATREEAEEYDASAWAETSEQAN